ncbi:MAG: type II secretion system major pseudopilin GspG [Pirellulales bacterium]|nr:type II secretion system major pseudopilin GspG [Pirellulales bacterium]
MRGNRDRNRSKRGFTLVEVLLVLAILVIIASLVVVAIGPSLESAKVNAARTQIGAFETALDTYRLAIGDFPTTAQGLEALWTQPGDLANPGKWKGPYLKKPVPLDPWDHPYQYESPGSNSPDMPDMWSFGPDGQDGTADDVTNWGQE